MPGDTTACETGSSRSEEDGNAAEMEERAYVKDEEPIHTKRRSRLSVKVSWGVRSGKHGVVLSSHLTSRAIYGFIWGDHGPL